MGCSSPLLAGFDLDLNIKSELSELLDIKLDDIHELDPDLITFTSEYTQHLSQQLRNFINDVAQKSMKFLEIKNDLMVRQKMYFIEGENEIYVCWESNNNFHETVQVPSEVYKLDILYN